jgi:hypothetical protein
MKIANRDARRYVQFRREFDGNNLFARHRESDDMYVVYSYGPHWPLFIYVHGLWYENADRYGTTTSKHHTQCHPHADTVKLSVDQMKVLDHFGYDGLVRQRLGVAA